MSAVIGAMGMSSEQNSNQAERHSQHQVTLAPRGKGPRLLKCRKCLPVGRHESKNLLGLYQQARHTSEHDPCAPQLHQLFEALDKLKLPQLAKDAEQPPSDFATPEQTSEEQALSPSSPETGKQLALIAASLQFSELLIALDPSLAEPGLAEKASDQELPEASALQLARVGPNLEGTHCMDIGTRQAQRRAELVRHSVRHSVGVSPVAALLPSALRGVKRAASLAQKAKERVQKASGDMNDVELAYVPV